MADITNKVSHWLEFTRHVNGLNGRVDENSNILYEFRKIVKEVVKVKYYN